MPKICHVNLRMPDDLRRKLVRAARKSKRSLNSELNARLSESLVAEESGEKGLAMARAGLRLKELTPTEREATVNAILNYLVGTEGEKK
jgi:plasmid stability protein